MPPQIWDGRKRSLYWQKSGLKTALGAKGYISTTHSLKRLRGAKNPYKMQGRECFTFRMP